LLAFAALNWGLPIIDQMYPILQKLRSWILKPQRTPSINVLDPTKYLVHKIFKKQILESGEDSKSIKKSKTVNQIKSQITQKHDGEVFFLKLSSRNLE
jgi:hypothetical protein